MEILIWASSRWLKTGHNWRRCTCREAAAPEQAERSVMAAYGCTRAMYLLFPRLGTIQVYGNRVECSKWALLGTMQSGQRMERRYIFAPGAPDGRPAHPSPWGDRRHPVASREVPIAPTTICWQEASHPKKSVIWANLSPCNGSQFHSNALATNYSVFPTPLGQYWTVLVP